MSTPGSERARRGRRNAMAGRAAEDAVARAYEAEGSTIRARRHRTPYGEIDLIVAEADCLVFVEVKRVKNAAHIAGIVSERQWLRLEAAAQSVIVNPALTGGLARFRFDAAIVAPDGAIRIVRNARIAEQ